MDKVLFPMEGISMKLLNAFLVNSAEAMPQVFFINNQGPNLMKYKPMNRKSNPANLIVWFPVTLLMEKWSIYGILVLWIDEKLGGISYC